MKEILGTLYRLICLSTVIVCDCKEQEPESDLRPLLQSKVAEDATHLNTRNSTEDQHGTIQHTQSSFDLDGEINVTCVMVVVPPGQPR